MAEATCEALAAAPPGAGNDWVVLVAIEPVDHATAPGLAIDLDARLAPPGAGSGLPRGAASERRRVPVGPFAYSGYVLSPTRLPWRAGGVSV